MTNQLKIIFLLALGAMISCTSGNSSSEIDNKENPDEKIAKSLEWKGTQLIDLPNAPTVFVAPNYDRAAMAMIDNQGRVITMALKMDNGKIIKDQWADGELSTFLGTLPAGQLDTRFLTLQKYLIKTHTEAASKCRSSKMSESIRNDVVEHRGPALLKLKGPWSDGLTGFELVLALDAKTGAFIDFVAIKSSATYESVGYASVLKDEVLFGPSGNAVRDFGPWNFECDEAYSRIMSTRRYKINEQEKMDKDASDLVDLDLRIGVFTTPFYPKDEISLEELKSQETK